MVIDFHTHLLPKEIVQNLESFAYTDAYFGYRMIDTPAKKNHQLWVTYQEALRDMERDGIHQILIQGWPFESHESCWRQNNYTLEAMKAHPERLLGFCIVNPRDGINALREVERCAHKGMLGVGELDPEGQGFRLDDIDFLRLCDLCVDLGLPISLHISEPVGSHYHGKSSLPLQDYVNLAIAKPLLKIILSHWGGGLPFYELMPDLQKSLANVYYDTASSPLHCSMGIFNETLNIVGDNKIIFGSNYPRLMVPNQEKETGFSTLLSEIKQEVMDMEALENILWNNARELLGLKQPGGDKQCRA